MCESVDDRVLRYPRRSLILLGGLPGAGKSTLLNRLYGLSGTETVTVRAADGTRIVDSLQSRNQLVRWLGFLPYPTWRWATHLLHQARIAVALRGDGPVVVHETATRPLLRLLLALYSRVAGAQLHLLLIDTPPDEARRGQLDRGRTVTEHSFRRHWRRWRRLLDAGARSPAEAVPRARSLVLLTRAQAAWVRRIDFRATPDHGDGGCSRTGAAPRGGPGERPRRCDGTIVR